MIMADDTPITPTDHDGSNDPGIIDATIKPEMPIVEPGMIPPVPQPEIIHIPKPEIKSAASAISDIREDETEFERIQRLKLDTADAPHSGAIGDDIAQILKDVKLPERRNFKASADKREPPSTPTPPVVEPAPKKIPPGPQERAIVTPLHTLKDDLQDVVRIRNMSAVRASALEQDKQRGQADLVPPPQPRAIAQRSRRTFTYLFFALLLVALGAAALYGVDVVMQSKSVTPAPQYASLIFSEQTETLPIDNTTPTSLKQTIAQARQASGAPLGSITRIVPTISTTTAAGTTSTTPATLAQFFAALGVQAPDGLLRGLGSDFFFGIHTVDINAPVFVIPVTSYDLAFAGMLTWESSMDQDLSPAFDAVPALTTGPDGLPTARTFTDAVMLNYDVRELKDDSGNVVLYYSFPTPNILVIAESPHSFTEVLSRLQAQREL